MKNIKYIAAAFLFSGMLSAQNIDLNAMPKPGPTPTINIAKPKTFQLKNGLTVLVVENNKLPRVNVSVNIDRTPVYEGDIAGVGAIMADQLGKGTTNLDKDQFNKKVDFLGANLYFSSKGAFGNTLSKYFPEVMKLMADAIINPKFSAEEIQKSKERTLENLKIAEKSADDVITKVSGAIMYGKNTALGEYEEKESVVRIKLQDVQNFYQKYYAPNNAYLVIVGDVKYEEVKKIVEKEFSKWKKSSVVIPALGTTKNVANTEVNIVDMPNAVQSVIQIKNISTLKRKDPQFFAGQIANYILGGGGEGRLFMNLREKNGFTYGAYSSLSTGKYSPNFTAEASVRNEVTDKAVVEFMNELNGISTITPKELENAKAKLKGSFIMSLEDPKTVADFAVNELIHQLPKDFYANYLKSIDKVTLSDVSNAAKSYILPKNARIFIAGKVSEIAEGVEKLGYPIKYYNHQAKEIEKPQAKKVDENITIETIGQNYINAIGGKANVEKISSLTSVAVGKIQGMELEMTTTLAKGGKSLVETKMMGSIMQKVVFDGKEGYIETQGKKMPLPEEVKIELQKNKEVFSELAYVKNSSYELKEIENINGEEAYAVKLGNKTSYYSTKTGLKIAEIAVQKMQGQEMSVPTYYSDYKEVNGVKLPFKMTSNMGGMDISFEMKSYEINKAKDSDFK